MVNHFLTSKKLLVESDDLTQRSFDDYFATCQRAIKFFGKSILVANLTPGHFERLRADFGNRWSANTVGNEVQRVRVLFKYAYDACLVDKPIRYGPNFKRPSKRRVRLEQYAKGARMFEAHEIQAMLEKARQPLEAMILLGINCGFGNHDIAGLPRSALDLESGWVEFPRPKTAVGRRIPLWPRTIKVVEDALRQRPSPKDLGVDHLVFLTKSVSSWNGVKSDRPISKEIAKLLKQLGIHRPGVGFYALRHTFETIGGESRDQVAVDAIMGHVPRDMGGVYRHRISDERLQSVVQVVHDWVFGSEA